MRLGKKQAVRTTLPAWLRHALAFNFIEGMHFNKQFAIRFQPLRAMTDEALRIRSAKDIQFPNVIIIKSKVPWGGMYEYPAECSQYSGLRLAPAGEPM